MIMEYNNINQGSICLWGLNKLRLENQLCDVILNISMQKIPAHKNILSACSPYFYAMFNGSFPESDQKTVLLQDIDGDSVKALIDYLYTGYLFISSENVQNLLSTACFLQITWAQEKCCEFLISELDANNCLGIKQFADKHSCQKLGEKAKKYIVEHFQQVSKSDEFLLINIEEFRDLLKYSELYNHSEDVIFNGILKWIQNFPEERSQYLSELLNSVHPLLVTKDLIATSKILENDPLCSNWITQAMNSTKTEWNIFILNKMGIYSDFQKYNFVSKEILELSAIPEKTFAVSLVGYKNTLFAQGGAIDRKCTNKTYCYNIYRDTWTSFSSLMVARSHHRSCILDDFIYAIGGNGPCGQMCNVESLDIATGITIQVEGMLDDRASMGAVVLDNAIYVMGGENARECIFSAERFDPRIGSWEELCDMNTVNSYCSSAIIDNHIYCAEGLGNSMERYDIRKNAWELIEFKEDREFYELFSVENELYSICSFGISKYCFKSNEWLTVFEFPFEREWDTAVPMQTKILSNKL